MSEKDIFKYEGEAVDVFWDERLCIHVGECGRAQGDLFVGGRKPWCQPDVTTLDEVLDVCSRCPTGALTYKTHDGTSEENAATENKVVVSYNGPLFLSGDLSIDGASDDMSGTKFRAALCRCGQSKKKPFCDNSHEAAGFKDYGAVGKSGDGTEELGGPLKVAKMPNGPLFVTGNFSIVAASGRVAWKGTKAALCRCGESKSKPFCDGAHKAAGFQAE